MVMPHRLAILAVLFLLGVPSRASETVVFSGYPEKKVESTSESLERAAISDSERREYQLLITKKDGKYTRREVARTTRFSIS